MAGTAGGGRIHQKPDGQFALFDVAFNVRMTRTGGDIPVDGAHIVARRIGTDFVEVHAATFENAAVFSSEQMLDRIAGLQLELAKFFVHISGHWKPRSMKDEVCKMKSE